MTLSLAYERCVRTRSVASSCRVCVDACPADAISLAGPKSSVEVSLDQCTQCGLCEAACPTEAFSGVLDVVRLGSPTRLACGEAGVPCVGAVSAEDLVALVMRSKRLELVGKACAGGPKGHARAQSAVAQARTFLAALGLPSEGLTWREEKVDGPIPFSPGGVEGPGHQVRVLDSARTERVAPPSSALKPVPPRRQFLGLFIPAVVPPPPQRLTLPDRLDVKRLRDTTPPARRARLLAALPTSASPKHADVPEAQIGFTSSKGVDAATCTGCMACVTACPTGALTHSRLKEQLRFDGSRCVKCTLCHDVCEPRAITLSPAFHPVDFLDFAPKTLLTLRMTQCGECGALFKDEGKDPVLCARCREHDAEARGLWSSR